MTQDKEVNEYAVQHTYKTSVNQLQLTHAIFFTISYLSVACSLLFSHISPLLPYESPSLQILSFLFPFRPPSSPSLTACINNYCHSLFHSLPPSTSTFTNIPPSPPLREVKYSPTNTLSLFLHQYSSSLFRNSTFYYHYPLPSPPPPLHFLSTSPISLLSPLPFLYSYTVPLQSYSSSSFKHYTKNISRGDTTFLLLGTISGFHQK